MISKYFASVVLVSMVAVSAQAQTYQRRANITGGNPGQGRCVVEVIVDGAAQVEIRGENATLQNLNGQPPQWRRFECTAPMPGNPVNFRFSGVDGRGKQQLIQAPQGGSVAVVRIEDPDNGSEGYTFEVTWGDVQAGGPPRGQEGQPRGYEGSRGPEGPPPAPRPGPGYAGGGYGGAGYEGGGRAGGFYTEDAIRLCQSYVRDEATRKFGANSAVFRQTMMDDQPGRNDWVRGYFEASRGRRVQTYSFSCSVNFSTGQVRSADLQLLPNGQSWYGSNPRGRTISACQASVEQRLRQDGYSRVDFGSAGFDDRAGRNDWIAGTVSTMDHNRPVWFDFSCQINPRDSSIRSVSVDRR